MRKAVVISSTKDDNYLFYLPVVVWCWNKLGWHVYCSLPENYTNDVPYLNKYELIVKNCGEQFSGFVYFEEPEIRTVTIAQCIRLYAADNIVYNKEIDSKSDGYLYDFLMISDIDMMPLSDYWQPKENEITAYGRDLSDKHYPMCYVAANLKNWWEIMNLTGYINSDMQRDLYKREDVNSDLWNEYWQVDQNLLTEKLNQQNVVRIDRGINPETGYPMGRVDRSAWDKSLLQKERIDAHLPREGYTEHNFQKILKLIKECFNPTEEEVKWICDYRNEYLKFI